MQEIIKTLEEQGVFNIKNGSVELFFDDEGILREMIFKKKRRKRPDEDLKIFSVTNGKSVVDYDKYGIIQQITYQTQWKRPRE